MSSRARANNLLAELLLILELERPEPARVRLLPLASVPDPLKCWRHLETQGCPFPPTAALFLLGFYKALTTASATRMAMRPPKPIYTKRVSAFMP